MPKGGSRIFEELGDIAAKSDILVECAKLTPKSDEELEQIVRGYPHSMYARLRKFFGLGRPVQYKAAYVLLRYRKEQKSEGSPDYS